MNPSHDEPAVRPAVPRGFQLAGVHCGLKQEASQPDLTLVVGRDALTAAGVYTRNCVVAAPVVWDRNHTPAADIRLVVANAGIANACTGTRGHEDVRESARLAAAAVGAREDQALVLSTGVIGQYLPMERIAAGISAAAGALAADARALSRAAHGILTTDTREKIASRSVSIQQRDYTLTGIAKGAGMIGPHMATVLAVLMTDANLSPDVAQRLLQPVVDDTFNCISVEGHMSTNDTVLLLASGAVGGPPLLGGAADRLQAALSEVCTELARAVPSDGEGASHLITIEVEGCASPGDARRLARAVADSPLVKTAIAGNDPNWGRIVSAAGYAGVPFDPAELALELNDTLLFCHGTPAPFDAAAVAQSMQAHHEVRIRLRLAAGAARCRFWTSDLTCEYVRINAEYHT